MDPVTTEPTLFERLISWLAPLRGALIWAMGPLNHQIGYLMLAIAIDTILAAYGAFKQGLFSQMILINKILEKILIYSMWIMLFNALDRVVSFPSGQARTAAIVVLLGLEISSAAKNTSKVGHSNLAAALTVAFKGIGQSTGGAQAIENIINYPQGSGECATEPPKAEEPKPEEPDAH